MLITEYSTPDPIEILLFLVFLMSLGFSFSCFVIELRTTSHFARFASASSFKASGIFPPPIIANICLNFPTFLILFSWRYKSSRVNFPWTILLTISGSISTSASCTFWTNDSISGIPSKVPINFDGSNSSNSSTFSPTPINLIPTFAATQADKAPPPFAVPSNLVTIILPKFVVSEKACAWLYACWPKVPSIIKIISFGFSFCSRIAISSINSFSSLCLPAVSAIMISFPSFNAFLVSWIAILTAFFSFGFP